MKFRACRLAALSTLVALGCDSSGADSNASGTNTGTSDRNTGGVPAQTTKASSNAVDQNENNENNDSAGGATSAPAQTGSGGATQKSAGATTRGPDGSGGTGRTSSAKSAVGGGNTRSSGGAPGSSATGGKAATGGAPDVGAAGKANATAPSTGAGTSPGCSSGKTTSTCGKSGSKCTLTVNGKERTYYLQLPANYDPSKPSPVVFQFHPLGGSAEQALTMYRISSGFPNAIYITPQGLSGSSPTGGDQPGWANQGGEDIQFTLDMLEQAKADFCVDTQRVFSMGFSYGGMMSYTIGCELAGVFRAIAPMSGALYSGCKGTQSPIAMWGAHGSQDTFVPTANGQKARDQILKQNHCGTETKPVDPSPCVAYQGCDEGYPVIWCEWDGSHAIPSFGSSAIAAFFRQF